MGSAYLAAHAKASPSAAPASGTPSSAAMVWPVARAVSELLIVGDWSAGIARTSADHSAIPYAGGGGLSCVSATSPPPTTSAPSATDIRHHPPSRVGPSRAARPHPAAAVNVNPGIAPSAASAAQSTTSHRTCPVRSTTSVRITPGPKHPAAYASGPSSAAGVHDWRSRPTRAGHPMAVAKNAAAATINSSISPPNTMPRTTSTPATISPDAAAAAARLLAAAKPLAAARPRLSKHMSVIGPA